ncbi:phosphatase PAP2 family protein [Aureimonas phyllosphaerae]|uniref:phosphatase PAP2 family protein n=1 Tax=Aureimonas phyllosphaerae TaxID=1166078 RepID=UPI003A5BFEB1
MIALITLYVLCTLAMTRESFFDLVVRLPTPFLAMLGMTVVTAIALGAVRCLAVTRPKSPIRQMLGEARDALKDGWIERWLPMALAGSLMMVVFGDTKTEIPALAGGFRWDGTFEALDRTLHGGIAPWELLHPVLGYPVVTYLLSLNYSLWFTLMWGMFFFHQTMRPGTLGRTRFLVSFVLLWTVGGTLLATLFSSAGPCYFGLVTAEPDPYQPLMAYLRQADAVLPLMALDIQDLLWAMKSAGVQGAGISAMPSLHNAVALLMFLATARLAPWVRLAFAIHFGLVFLGSIHLGWHYAVDAYASFALTLVVWFGLGPLADRWDRFIAERRPAMRRPVDQFAATSSARP